MIDVQKLKNYFDIQIGECVQHTKYFRNSSQSHCNNYKSFLNNLLTYLIRTFNVCVALIPLIPVSVSQQYLSGAMKLYLNSSAYQQLPTPLSAFNIFINTTFVNMQINRPRLRRNLEFLLQTVELALAFT